MNVHFIFQTKAGRVTDYRLPGAVFEGRRAYEEFAADRRAYEAAVAAYAAAMEPAAIKEAIERRRSKGTPANRKAAREDAEFLLRVDLGELGYPEDDIEWHIANPGERERREYAFGDLGALLNG
ncbi:hypothetical protein AB4853_16475 [Bradyrhizobium sp. 1050_B9_N1_2]|uniref:hypothetical protein n=1 Tax=Bradyrhizobium sp. 1050_B9_N1_2 TaxID=3238688 RepID=UPI003EDC3D9D